MGCVVCLLACQKVTHLALVCHENQRPQGQWQSDESGQRVEAVWRDRIESLPYQLDGSVVGYHGYNEKKELGFDSGEGA